MQCWGIHSHLKLEPPALQGLMKMLGNDTQEYVELHRMLFNPYRLYMPGQLDDILRGALDTHAAKVDPYFSEEVTTVIKSCKISL
jgi:hypothetical protein